MSSGSESYGSSKGSSIHGSTKASRRASNTMPFSAWTGGAAPF